jgi:uncharacterized protein YukE
MTILFVFVLCMLQYAIADDDLNQLEKDIKKTLRSLGIQKSEESKNNEQDLTRAIQAFNETLESDDKETKEILKQWDEYIASVTHYSSADYAKAINKQLTDYYNAIDDLNSTIKKNKDKRRGEYSSSWVDDLVDHFGKEFIKKNKMAIKQSLLALVTSDEDFERKLKDLMYLEVMLFGSYERYYGLFLTFCREELDHKAKKKIESRKDIAESFLVLIDKVSFTSMHNTIILQNVLTENEARQHNNEVFAFLKNHALSHTFDDLIRVLEDLKKATEK